MTHEEKQAIVDATNALYGCTVPLEIVELAISYGFTNWELLRSELEAAQNGQAAAPGGGQ